MGWLWGGLGIAFALFLLVLLVRAWRFRPSEVPSIQPEPLTLDQEKIVADMAEMIRCKTVSYRERELEDPTQFEKFQRVLQERFPRIHQACTLTHLGRNGLLYHLPGKQADYPCVCMAHYDVVPVEEEDWTKPAFAGLVEDGYIWGRGTLDTKGTLCGVMEALEHLLAEGYVPQNDLYLSFSGEEEIDGDTCPEIVRYFTQQGITPALVLDEGGAVVEKVFPGVEKECALIGIAEKGTANLHFSLLSTGGHASTPPPHTVLGYLAQAVIRVEKHHFRWQLTPAVSQMFNVLGRHSSFLYRLIFANLWCFAPVLDMICKKSGGELNAMMRTTTAVTRMRGSDAYNVLPHRGYFSVNMRLMGTDTIESATAHLRKVIHNPDIRIRLINGTNPSPCSVTKGDGWEALTAAVRETWPEAIVSPYLMMAASDSRHFSQISDRVYRFSAMRLSKEERGLIHGNDERIPIHTLMTTVEFYVRLLKKL